MIERNLAANMLVWWERITSVVVQEFSEIKMQKTIKRSFGSYPESASGSTTRTGLSRLA
jgi:hypothetical protein